MPTVLVIDDDRTVLSLVRRVLQDMNVAMLTAESAHDGLAMLRDHSVDALLLDILLPDGFGLEVANQVRAHDPLLPVTFITISDDSDIAIEAMKLGAYDFLLKPLNVENVRDVIARALEIRRLMRVPVALAAEGLVDASSSDKQPDLLIGRSPQFLNVYKEIGRVAAQDVAVLICGESGTGKELVARAIYHHSHRQNSCFLAVNCAALSDTLLESELFGHEKGAFTGADRRRIGKFEQCNGGTIFLDEVGDMSPLTQSKVLRLLQEQQFERVGGTETIETDVRIISATNQNLEWMINQGDFRLDLYHRLNGYRIDLPPLRERGEDINLLVNHFLTLLNNELGKDIQGVAPEVMQCLRNYHWPGNVRELQALLRKAALRATGPILVPDFLPDLAHSNSSRQEPPDRSPLQDDDLPSDIGRFIDEKSQAGSNFLYAEGLEMFERYLLTRILRESSGNQSKAAERLGITRGSLRHKIRVLGISIDQVVQSGQPVDAP